MLQQRLPGGDVVERAVVETTALLSDIGSNPYFRSRRSRRQNSSGWTLNPSHKKISSSPALLLSLSLFYSLREEVSLGGILTWPLVKSASRSIIFSSLSLLDA